MDLEDITTADAAYILAVREGQRIYEELKEQADWQPAGSPSEPDVTKAERALVQLYLDSLDPLAYTDPIPGLA